MLGPLVPHIAEELWERLGNEGSVVHQRFPAADATLLIEESVEIPVQINGKVRSRVTVASSADVQAVEEAVLADRRIAELLVGKETRKVIVIPGKMVNIVVS
jgi:leucyl-tRNA synthetase